MSRRRRPGDPKLVVGYVRASKEEQQLTRGAQRTELKRWCKDNDAELLEVVEDLGVSGAAPLDKRPGLLEALGMLRDEKAGVLLVARRDRLARDAFTAAMVDRLAQRNGARVVAVDLPNLAGPEAALVATMMDAVAQYERALIAQRTCAALAEKRARGGKSNSTPPFGYRYRGAKVVRHPAEQRALEAIRRWHRQGKGPAKILELLERRKHRARGGRWHYTTVYRIVSRLSRETK